MLLTQAWQDILMSRGRKSWILFTFPVSPQIYCTVAWRRKDSDQHRYRGCVDIKGSKEEHTGRPDFCVTEGKENHNKWYILDSFVAWKMITFYPSVSRCKCFLFIVSSFVAIYLYMCECMYGRLIFLLMVAQIGLSVPDTVIIHLMVFTAELIPAVYMKFWWALIPGLRH